MAERRNVGGEGSGDDPTHRMIERIWESLTEILVRLDQQPPVQPAVVVPPFPEEAVPVAPVPPPPGVEVPPIIPVQPAVLVRPVTGEETTLIVERFLRLQPPTYSGGPNPDTAEHWIHEIKRVFAIMRCPEEDKVILAAYQLRGFAQEWWRLKMQIVFTGRTKDTIPWSEFLSVFNDSFFPIQIQQMKREQFRTLQQGNLSVLEYQMRFIALSRYAPYVVTDNTMMVEYFIRGLRPELQDAVIPLMCRTVEEAAQRAAILERTVRARQGQSQIGGLGSGSFRHPQPSGGISKGKALSRASSSSGIAKWGKQIKKFFQGGRGRGRQQGFQQGRGYRPPISEESQQRLGFTTFHCEDATWSGGNVVRASFFAFFTKVGIFPVV
ncbi:hypothetical protein Taro_019927 [Colocasia esculenta]|uniref:Retrotransposon gag domain-containing protein n=1 Tax=Colocasia esculenta TaxID=4460 RepID=A0A843UY53_COLES|nr:hypothetical protein [Colocasia esculenta]